jgi:hypothetical protein
MDTGVYSLLSFYSEFIKPHATSGVAAQEAHIAPLLNWYRAACTNNNAGESAISIDPVTSGLPLQNLLLQQGWAARSKNLMKVALGTGGPAVTSVAFAAGVNQLENAIQDTGATAITYQWDAPKKTFTEQYGTSIAHRSCTTCATWPMMTTFLKLTSFLLNLLKVEPTQSWVALLKKGLTPRTCHPLTAGCLPLATTKMTDQVFRSFKPACTGISFREGLSPFACVCEGDAESQTAQPIKVTFLNVNCSLT